MINLFANERFPVLCFVQNWEIPNWGDSCSSKKYFSMLDHCHFFAYHSEGMHTDECYLIVNSLHPLLFFVWKRVFKAVTKQLHTSWKPKSSEYWRDQKGKITTQTKQFQEKMTWDCVQPSAWPRDISEFLWRPKRTLHWCDGEFDKVKHDTSLVFDQKPV